MKSLFFNLLIVGSVLTSFAQSSPEFKKADKILELFEGIENQEFSQEAQSEDQFSVFDITAENWDTKHVKIEYNKKVNFPLQIAFNDSVYVSPISKNKVITSRYGWRWGRAHRGIDIDLITGDSLFAMFDGIVRFANYSSGHGRTVVVRHYNGVETLYAHLSSYGVKANDTVKAGDFLGKGGRSGNARGSHLHLEMTYNGVHINPEYLLKFDDNNDVNASELWVTKKWTRPELHNSKRQSKLDLLTTEEELEAYLERPTEVYVVRKGDTLSRISARNNVSITALCKSNHIRENSTLRIGQKLVIEKTL
ncbi:peptidoglycan DD-metalloendopeptidase family protein [Hanstruepera marina]|uniref:peptidoglycan DD-metalloendopeptidase family protein n=1 Tax=Hanstruepera marina TaxID=2873265 RepID=UPI001CA603FC|nr:peptidoglycan DD-metalloendopeptidase family protein [Hanstruepera marina]